MHLEIGREQIIAAVGFLPGAFEKELGMKAFTHQATLHIGQGDYDGVDFGGSDQFPKRFQCQITRHGSSLIQVDKGVDNRHRLRRSKGSRQHRQT